jgi:hypothetical protein
MTRRTVGFLAPLLLLAATASAEPLLLAGKQYRLELPPGYQVLSVTPTGDLLTLRSGDSVLVSILISRQQGLLTNPTVRKSRIRELLDQLRSESRSLAAEILAPAAVIDDPAWYAKVSDRIKTAESTLLRARTLRLTGRDVLTQYTVVSDPDPDKAARALAAAETALLARIEPNRSVPATRRSGESPKPTDTAVTLRRARLKFETPEGLAVRPHDLPEGGTEGVVAVLVDPAHPARRLSITVVPVIPATPGAEVSNELLIAAADRAVTLESARIEIPDAEPEAVFDSRFFRRQRRTGGDPSSPFVSDTRQLRIGNAIVSIAMITTPADEDEASKLADELAESITPLRR